MSRPWFKPTWEHDLRVDDKACEEAAVVALRRKPIVNRVANLRIHSKSLTTVTAFRKLVYMTQKRGLLES